MPDFSVRDWQQMASYRCEADLIHVLDGLRLAGLPEENSGPPPVSGGAMQLWRNHRSLTDVGQRVR